MLSNMLLVPAWAFQALGARAGAFTGSAYEFSADRARPWMRSARPSRCMAVVGIWLAALAGAIQRASGQDSASRSRLWAMQAIAPTVFRAPETARYLYPGAVVVLLVAHRGATGHPLDAALA